MATRLDVAAFLLVRGFQIARVEFEANAATFVFEDPERRADAIGTKRMEAVPTVSGLRERSREEVAGTNRFDTFRVCRRVAPRRGGEPER
jgi:Domain of unknown function (DUF5659)